MATYVGSTHPDTGAAASTGNGWWFGGQFSGGEPVYYQAALPSAPPPPPSSGGGGSTGSSAAAPSSTASASSPGGFWESQRKFGHTVNRGNPRFGIEQVEGIDQNLRNDTLLKARNEFLYNQNPSYIEALANDPDFGLSQEEYEQWFSPGALTGLVTAYRQHLESESENPWSPFGDSWMTDILDAAPFGEVESFLGDPDAQLIDYGLNPVLYSGMLGEQDQSNALDLGRMAGRAMAAYGIGAGAAAAGAPAAAPALNAGVGMLSGGDPRMVALNAAIGYGADAAAPYVDEAWRNTRGFWDEGALPPVQFADAGTTMTDVGAPGVATGGGYDLSTGAEITFPEGATSGGFGGMLPSMPMPPAVPEEDPTFEGELTETEPGTFEPTPPAPAPDPAITGKDLQRYARAAKTLYDMLGGREGGAESSYAPEDAPTHDEAESEEQYSEELAEYLALDPASMAEAGLEPGSPEYLEYILAQADSVISQVLEGVDVDAEDLASQLRGKTQKELVQLQRALYVRGQLNMLMGSGTYSDPVTGTPEKVIGDGMFNPGVAAYQRGRARDVEELAGLRGQKAQSYLDELLGRSPDMFGMETARQERLDLARRNDREEELRRRRGMFSY